MKINEIRPGLSLKRLNRIDIQEPKTFTFKGVVKIEKGINVTKKKIKQQTSKKTCFNEKIITAI